MDSGVEYYDRRAHEYDATSWEYASGEPEVAERVRDLLTSLPPMSTLEVACGTGYVSRWLPGRLTLLDSSAAMLAIARSRVPNAVPVQAQAPSLPFVPNAFDRGFTANFYGHLVLSERRQFVREMLRVADELIVLDQLASSGAFREGLEERQLTDGSSFMIHKCYFTLDRLLQELGGGDVLMPGPFFAIVRRIR
jgi:SAM-dependent methyltransferase